MRLLVGGCGGRWQGVGRPVGDRPGVGRHGIRREGAGRPRAYQPASRGACLRASCRSRSPPPVSLSRLDHTSAFGARRPGGCRSALRLRSLADDLSSGVGPPGDRNVPSGVVLPSGSARRRPSGRHPPRRQATASLHDHGTAITAESQPRYMTARLRDHDPNLDHGNKTAIVTPVVQPANQSRPQRRCLRTSKVRPSLFARRSVPGS